MGKDEDQRVPDERGAQAPEGERRGIHHLSASQFKEFDRCPLAWLFRKREGRAGGASPATAFGVLLHGLIEGHLLGRADEDTLWLLTSGEDPDEHRPEIEEHLDERHHRRALRLRQMAIDAGLVPNAKQVQQFRQYYEVERDIEGIIDIDGIPVYGYIDLCWLHRPAVWDHKTTSNIARWGATAETLRGDPQMLLYAYARLQYDDQPDAVEVRHIQYQRKGCLDVAEVHTTLSRERIEAGFSALVEKASRMQEVWEMPLDEAPHGKGSGACRAYGGCPHRAVCPAHGHAPGRQDDLDSLIDMALDKPAPDPAPAMPADVDTETVMGQLAARSQPVPTPVSRSTPILAPSAVDSRRRARLAADRTRSRRLVALRDAATP